MDMCRLYIGAQSLCVYTEGPTHYMCMLYNAILCMQAECAWNVCYSGLHNNSLFGKTYQGITWPIRIKSNTTIKHGSVLINLAVT